MRQIRGGRRRAVRPGHNARARRSKTAHGQAIPSGPHVLAVTESSR